MAELTPQDRENYGKLKTAFGELAKKYQHQSTPIAEITKSVNSNLTDLINGTGELRKKVDLVDGYLEIQALLLPNESAVVQEILNLNEELKRSLKVVEDETLDLTEGIEEFQSDSLFFELIPTGMPKEWTKKLIDDIDPLLKEKNQIEDLTEAWGNAVTTFVEDARKKEDKDGKVTPLQPETFAHFFRIHKELEVLYSRLADSETVRESEI